MRILLQPIIGSADLALDSTAVLWQDFIRCCLKITEKLWFYVLLPKGYKNYDAFERLPHTTVIIEERKRRRFFEEIDMFDMDTVYRLFNMRTGVYQIDAVITQKTGVALLLQKVLSDIRYASERDYLKIPVLIVEDRAWSRSETHQFVDWQEFMLRSMSYASCRSVLWTNLEREEILDVASLYLSESALLRMRENSVVVPQGYPVEEVDRIVEGVKKRDKFTLFWGGRMTGQKRVPFILEQYLKMFESGLDVDIIITTPSLPSPKTLSLVERFCKRWKGLKILFNVKRRDFLRLCASSHVWLSASLYEGFTVGHVEMAATGVPGIVPRRPWSEEIFGSDYELMYNPRSFGEAATLLRWVYENYDEAVEIGRRTRERMRKSFDKMYFAEMVLGILSDMCQEELSRGLVMIKDGTKTAELLEVVMSKFKALGYERVKSFEVLSEMRKLSYGKGYGGELMQYPSLWDVRKWLIENGLPGKCWNNTIEMIIY